MKTPSELADEQMRAFTIQHDEDVEERSAEYIHEQIVEAIEADRAQAPSIPVGAPGSIGHVPEQIARLIREMAALDEAERKLREAQAAVRAAEKKVTYARQRADAQARQVGSMGLRAGWVTPELVSEVRP
ncbi:hypothetical protein [Agromyces sp. NPDC058104]|uniref:hypothetical protein n=1 Tax=Agromyces sp. NPDC058104 TaxID=3346342 RepID=UPI0036DB7B53